MIMMCPMLPIPPRHCLFPRLGDRSPQRTSFFMHFLPNNNKFRLPAC